MSRGAEASPMPLVGRRPPISARSAVPPNERGTLARFFGTRRRVVPPFLKSPRDVSSVILAARAGGLTFREIAEVGSA
jgi:hypothetical protein